MAGDATDVIPRVLRVQGVHVLRATGMAVQAARVNLLRGGILEGEYLCLVPAAIDVRFARTMASFAAMPFRPSLGIQHRYVVR